MGVLKSTVTIEFPVDYSSGGPGFESRLRHQFSIVNAFAGLKTRRDLTRRSRGCPTARRPLAGLETP